MVGPWSMTLGERLIQLDRVETPLVIDRQALENAGIGPRSRPSSTEPMRRSLDGFRELGLVVVPVGRILLVSTPAARPDLRGGPLSQRALRASWISALESAAARGSDPTDRFQSVTRWRGAATPEARPLERPGATHQRWLKVGPPPARFAYETTSRLSQFAGTVGLSAGVFALGVWLRGRSRTVRLAFLGVTLGLVMMAALLAHAGLDGWPTGLLLGWLATLAFWVGQALRPASRPRSDSTVHRASSSSSSAARATPSGSGSASVSVSVLLLALGLILPVSPLLAFQDDNPAREPILVLIPYDQTPDPSAPGPRFVLRLTDFETLQALARSSTPPPPAIALSAT